MTAKIFNESGRGYWLEGFGCIRAGGGYNDANTGHAVVIEKEVVQMDERHECQSCWADTADFE